MAAAGVSLLSLPNGFPDGYVSPWDQATQAWVTGLMFALLVAGIFTLAAAAMSKPGRATVGAALCVLFGFGLGLADGCPQMDWCRASVEQLTGVTLDDGQGG
jgi:uncharacterized membrane protein YccC